MLNYHHNQTNYDIRFVQNLQIVAFLWDLLRLLVSFPSYQTVQSPADLHTVGQCPGECGLWLRGQRAGGVTLRGAGHEVVRRAAQHELLAHCTPPAVSYSRIQPAWSEPGGGQVQGPLQGWPSSRGLCVGCKRGREGNMAV